MRGWATTVGLFFWAVLLGLTAVSSASPERGLRGFLVVRGERVLGQENAERLLTPGSVHKLLVTAAALHHLGPEYRVRTTVTGKNPISGGVLGGDLVVQAAGDPTWNPRFFDPDPRAPLRSLARQLKARGLRLVTGDLVIDIGRFPGRSWPVSRPGSELAFAYGAPTSALAIDESAVRVEIAPGTKVGAPGRLRPLAGATNFDWVNRIVTVGRQRHERGTVDFFPTWQDRTVVVRGEYPISEPAYPVPVAVPHPDLYAAEALRAVLVEEGVRIDGQIRIEAVEAKARIEARARIETRDQVLAEVLSPPLSRWLPPILRDSHNWYAEMLLRLLAAEVHGEGRDDEGLALVKSFLEDEVGLPEGAFVLDDASGLSPYNLLSPEAVVGLLRYVWRQPWRDVFVVSLATNNQGTLRAWGRLPSLSAKTGTVRQSVAIAGFLDPRSPEPVIFAALLNHRFEERHVLRAELAALIRRWAPR